MYVYMIRVSKEYIACRCLKVAKIYVKKICEKICVYLYMICIKYIYILLYNTYDCSEIPIFLRYVYV